ncbi:hypothetical protein ACFPMF_01815 [Larkinella bovis]|uniref:Uncharacterized protein n=1 Tax=Larkinella bovis TaxID=683041 RepID=A0ABW0I401_9BACT
MNKLKLKLNKTAFQTLNNTLYLAIEQRTADPELKRNIGEYTISSLLYELYTKVNKKNDDLNWFAYTADQQFPVVVSRSQALALYYVFTSETEGQSVVLFAPASYERALVESILTQIHKSFLV